MRTSCATRNSLIDWSRSAQVAARPCARPVALPDGLFSGRFRQGHRAREGSADPRRGRRRRTPGTLLDDQGLSPAAPGRFACCRCSVPARGRSQGPSSCAGSGSGREPRSHDEPSDRLGLTCPDTSSSSNMTARPSPAGNSDQWSVGPAGRRGSDRAILRRNGAHPLRRAYRCRRPRDPPGRPCGPDEGMARRYGAQCNERPYESPAGLPS